MISQSQQVKIDQIAFVVDDPVVTGQQLLDLANKRPADQYLIYQVLQTGQMEGVRPDETIDLRKPGIEKFLTFASDRAFFFTLDGRKLEWAASAISGRQLKDLAGINDPLTYEVWQEVRGSDDRAIGDRAFVSLDSPGTERFFTGKKTTTEG